MRLTLLAAMTAAAPLLWAAPSGAQDAEASEAEAANPDAQARELYLRGDRLYSEGRYEESIALFTEAHELSGRPELLFNLANAYERAGRLEEAIAALRDYAPSAPAVDQDTIVRRIRAIEARLEEQSEPTGPLETLPPPREETATGASSSGSGGGTSDASGGGSSVPLLASGGVLLGLGVATGVVGLVLALLKQDATAEAEMLCMDGVCADGAQDALARESSMALGADVSFGVGGALALTGVILLIVGASADDGSTDRAVIRPRIGPTQGGVDVVAHF